MTLKGCGEGLRRNVRSAERVAPCSDYAATDGAIASRRQISRIHCMTL